jgi:hypothetical protein
MVRKILATSVLVSGFFALQPAWAAGEAAATVTGPDPWTKVPKFPTSCYSGQDKGWEEVGTASQALGLELKKQQETNDKIEQKFNAIDMRVKMERMQAFLMENPQEAAKYMQTMQDQASSMKSSVLEEEPLVKALDADLKGIQEKFDAALKRATAPLYAKMDTLFSAPEGSEAARKDIAIQKQLYDQINAEYEKLCPAYWGPSGAFTAWMGRYKQYFVEHRIPFLMEHADTLLGQYKVMQFDYTGYHPTATMESVYVYMQKAYDVFNRRWTGPTGS